MVNYQGTLPDECGFLAPQVFLQKELLDTMSGWGVCDRRYSAVSERLCRGGLF